MLKTLIVALLSFTVSLSTLNAQVNNKTKEFEEPTTVTPAEIFHAFKEITKDGFKKYTEEFSKNHTKSSSPYFISTPYEVNIWSKTIRKEQPNYKEDINLTLGINVSIHKAIKEFTVLFDSTVKNWKISGAELKKIYSTCDGSIVKAFSEKNHHGLRQQFTGIVEKYFNQLGVNTIYRDMHSLYAKIKKEKLSPYGKKELNGFVYMNLFLNTAYKYMADYERSVLKKEITHANKVVNKVVSDPVIAKYCK